MATALAETPSIDEPSEAMTMRGLSPSRLCTHSAASWTRPSGSTALGGGGVSSRWRLKSRSAPLSTGAARLHLKWAVAGQFQVVCGLDGNLLLQRHCQRAC